MEPRGSAGGTEPPRLHAPRLGRRELLGGGLLALAAAAGGALEAVRLLPGPHRTVDAAGQVGAPVVGGQWADEDRTVPVEHHNAALNPMTRTPWSQPLPVEASPAYTVHDLLPHASRRAVALTIDDGPDPSWTPLVLSVLSAHRVRATFGLVGEHVAAYPGLARAVVGHGHAVTNHTLHHLEPFTARPASQIETEITGGLRTIWRFTGVRPALFRAPGGDWDPFVFRTVAREGMRPVDWDVDPRDWALPGVGEIVARLLAARPDDIMICHDGGGVRAETVQALRIALPVLLARGYDFVPLDPRLPA